MNFYHVNADVDGDRYFTTLAAAKSVAREAAKDSYSDIEVEAVVVATDKATVLAMLNMAGGHDSNRRVVFTAKARKK